MYAPTPFCPSADATARSASDGTRWPLGWLWITTSPGRGTCRMAGTGRRLPRARTRISLPKPSTTVPSANTSLPPASTIAARKASAAARVNRSSPAPTLPPYQKLRDPRRPPPPRGAPQVRGAPPAAPGPPFGGASRPCIGAEMAPPPATTVGLVQMRCSTDPAENLSTAIARIEDAAQRGAKIVCLQELFRSQYFCQREDTALFDLAEPIPGPSTEALGRVAAARGVVIVASLFEKRAEG